MEQQLNNLIVLYFYSIIGIFLTAAFSVADVKLPAIFGDGMVLQQNSNVAFWGWAEPGEEVTIEPDWQLSVESVIADSNGKWKLMVKTPKAGTEHTIAVKGNNTVLIKNVLLGEVWLCSGQSNMDWSVKNANNSNVELKNADYPKIKIFKVSRMASHVPLDDCKGEWKKCNSDTIANYSAVGYFYGRELCKELNVPIGLIQSAWGGTPIESWMKRSVLESSLDYNPILDRLGENLKNYDSNMKMYTQKVSEWQGACAEAESKGIKVPSKPSLPVNLHTKKYPTYLYNGMIHPIIPFTIKGVIWYQGESNADRAYQYRSLFPTMIQSWRDDWGISDFPFYYVQIAPYRYKLAEVCPELQEAQFLALSKMKNVGMAVITDIGDVNNIHPRNKQDVGKRLARWALSKTYCFNNIICSGPLYSQMSIENGRIRVYFDYSENGLVVKGENLTEFQIAGSNKNFVEAKAFIDEGTVIVYSENIPAPVAVRFGWKNTAQPNLFNGDGLPASPFRTDEWDRVTLGKK